MAIFRFSPEPKNRNGLSGAVPVCLLAAADETNLSWACG
jgi:hypothetical protein